MPTKAKRTTARAHDTLDDLKLQHHSICQYPACTAPATAVDLIAEGGTHDWHNLLSHCTAHQTTPK